MVEYFGRDKLNLDETTILAEIVNLIEKREVMKDLIELSFLSPGMKKEYDELPSQRCGRLMRP